MRVLLVDDDDMVRNSLGLLLEDAGFCVAQASDGQEAIGAYRRAPADVVLCDLFMPGHDGLEVIRDLRREFPGVRILAMSGGGCGGAMDVLPIARCLGAADVLAKPFDRKTLLARIHGVLRAAAV